MHFADLDFLPPESKILRNEAGAPVHLEMSGSISRYPKSFKTHYGRLRFMKCPVCKDPDLAMSERQGIEIDYCPTCRGVWLDRGELDKLIERSRDASARSFSGEVPVPPVDPYYQDHGYPNHHDKHGNHHWKRKSWLGDLFD